MQSNNLSRREKVKIRQRQEMMAAALDLFSEKGFHNVTMHEIAAKSEFAIGTLYKFFSNKEELYRALIQEQADRFETVLLAALESAEDEPSKLRNYVKAKGEVFRDNAATIRLYFAETRGVGFHIMAGMEGDIRNRHRRFLRRLEDIFDSGIKAGRFIKLAEPYALAVAFDGICNAFLVLWLEQPEKYPYPEDPDTILNILFRGLIRS
jgi:AcrR family transcriptional regulator